MINSEQVLQELVAALSGQALPPTLAALRAEAAALVEASSEQSILAGLESAVHGWQASKKSDLRQARRTLEALVRRASKWDTVKAEGLAWFPEQNRPRIRQLFAECRKLGLFIVPKGELESWLPLGGTKGKEWNRKALEDLHTGQCPADLHDFVAEVVGWVRPPETRRLATNRPPLSDAPSI